MKFKLLVLLLVFAGLTSAMTNGFNGSLDLEQGSKSCGGSLPCFAYWTFTPSRDLVLEKRPGQNFVNDSIIRFEFHDLRPGVGNPQHYPPAILLDLLTLVNKTIPVTDCSRTDLIEYHSNGSVSRGSCLTTYQIVEVPDYKMLNLAPRDFDLNSGTTYHFRARVLKPANKEVKYSLCMFGVCEDPIFGSEIEYANFTSNWTNTQGGNNFYWLYVDSSVSDLSTQVSDLVYRDSIYPQWYYDAGADNQTTYWQLNPGFITWNTGGSAFEQNASIAWRWKVPATYAWQNNYTMFGVFDCDTCGTAGSNGINLSIWSNTSTGNTWSLLYSNVIATGSNTTINVTATNLQANESMFMLIESLGNDAYDFGKLWNFTILGRAFEAGNVSIASPINQNYLIGTPGSSTLNFSVLQPTSGASYTCWYNLNGAGLTFYGNTTSNVYNQTSLAVGAGAHNVAVTCSDGVVNSTVAQDWTISDLGSVVINPASVWELNSTSYELQLTHNGNITSVNSSLWIGGQVVPGANITKGSNATTSTFSFSRIHPIVQSNGTVLSLVWNASIRWANGTLANRNFTGSQTEFQSFALLSVIGTPVVAVEGDNVIFNSSILRLSPNGIISGILTFNNTNVSSTLINYDTWQTNHTAPTIVTGTQQKYFFQHMSISYQSNSRTLTLPSFSNNTNAINVTAVQAQTCFGSVPAGYSVIYNFTSLDEETWIPTLSNWEAGLDVLSSTGALIKQINTTASNSTFFPICFTPSGVVVKISSIQSYEGSGYGSGIANSSVYPRRFYFITNATINTSTQNNFTVFLFNSSIQINGFEVAKQFSVRVRTQGDVGVSDAVVVFERFFIGNITSTPVAMTKMSNDGTGVAYLRSNDVFYVVKVIKNGALLYTSEKKQIHCSPASTDCSITITIDENANRANYWSYRDQLAFTCQPPTAGYQNGTGLFSCQFVDTSGLVQTWNLTIYKLNQIGAGVDCTNSSTASSGTIYCQVSNNSLGYAWQFSVLTQNTATVLDEGYINEVINNPFGTTGLITAMIIIVTIGAVGVASAPLAIIMTAFGLLIAFLTGFLPIGIAAVIGLIVALLVSAWVSKT